MTMLAIRHPAIPELIRTSIRRSYAYRMSAIFRLGQMLLLLFLLRTVWEALYSGRESVDGISGQTMRVYLTVSTLQTFLIASTIAQAIDTRIQRGTIATDMVRPVGFVYQMLAIDIGTVIGRLPFLIVAMPLTMLIGTLRPPSSVFDTGAYLMSLVLAYVVGMLIWLLVGLSGFWLVNAQGVSFLVAIVWSFLAGGSVPYWFLPAVLWRALEWLPFQATGFLPLSIYVGERSPQETVTAIGLQIGWIVVLSVLAAFVWSRAQRRIVVLGG